MRVPLVGPARTLLLVACATAVPLAACGGSTTIVKTVTTEADPPARSEPVSQPSESTAGIGDQLTLAASDSTLKIRLTDVIDPLPVGEYDSARAGNRFVGVELVVKNMGPEAYSDALSNGSSVILRGAQQTEPTIVSGGPCGNDFGVDVKIAADDKRVGCIAFEVPERKPLRSFQFTPQSGFGEETGEWDLPDTRSSGGDAEAGSESAPVPAAAEDAAPVPASAPAPAATQWTSCDTNISAKTPGTTCEFASNLFYEYWVGGQTAAVTAYSPASGTFHSATCINGSGTVTCTSPDGSAARFPQSAVDAYSQSQADSYASSHDVGF